MPHKDPIKAYEYWKEYHRIHKRNPFSLKYSAMKSRVKRYPQYKDVTICDEWNESKEAFMNWCEKEFLELNITVSDREIISRYEIDKDYSQSKIYSPSTCIIIPHRLNSIIINQNNNIEKRFNGKYAVRMGDGTNNRISFGVFPNREYAILMARQHKLKIIHYWVTHYVTHKFISRRAYNIILNYIKSKYNEILPDLNRVIGVNTKDRIFSI